jgi:1,4-dihydroxy-2-naphthoyl-CoA hydrolase
MAEEADPTRTLYDLMPFARTLGFTVTGYEPAEVRARLDWSPHLCTAGGGLHGGVLMALADSTGGACAYLNLPAGALHTGRTVIVVETNLSDERGRLAARVTQTQLVLTGAPTPG